MATAEENAEAIAQIQAEIALLQQALADLSAEIAELRAWRNSLVVR